MSQAQKPLNFHYNSFQPYRTLAKDQTNDCTVLEQCRMCTRADQTSIPSCEKTGKVRVVQCTGDDNGGKEKTVPLLEFAKLAAKGCRDRPCSSRSVVKTGVNFHTSWSNSYVFWYLLLHLLISFVLKISHLDNNLAQTIPCDRTQADEEFLMIRLQIMCLITGALAFGSVRRQRYSASNLFDQRRQTGNTNSRTTSPLPPPPALLKRSKSNTQSGDNLEMVSLLSGKTEPKVPAQLEVVWHCTL